MRWSEFKKLAVAKGWREARKGRNHDIYRKQGRTDMLIIERHESTEIRPGLLHRLLKQIED